MKADQARHDVPFYRASTVEREFLVVSEVRPVRMHWIQPENRAVLCGRDRCALCRDAFRSEVRWLVRLKDRQANHYFMELREPQRKELEAIQALQELGQSAWISVSRAGPARNDRVVVRVLKEVSFDDPFSLRNLVEAVYGKARTIGGQERVEPDSSLPPGCQDQDTRSKVSGQDELVDSFAAIARRKRIV